MEKFELKVLLELIKKYPNDQDLGKNIRKLLNKTKPEVKYGK